MKYALKALALCPWIIIGCGVVSGAIYGFILVIVTSWGTHDTGLDVCGLGIMFGGYFGAILGFFLGLFDGITMPILILYYLAKKKDNPAFITRVKIVFPILNFLILLGLYMLNSNDLIPDFLPPVIAIGTVVSSIALWKFAVWLASTYKQDQSLQTSAGNEPS